MKKVMRLKSLLVNLIDGLNALYGTFTDIFKFLLIDDSETKKKILELAFKVAYSKGMCFMNDYSCEDATDNSLALRNDLLCTKM